MGQLESSNQDLYTRIAEMIVNGRKQVRTAVNTTLVITYWHIGRLIVEDEQKGGETGRIR